MRFVTSTLRRRSIARRYGRAYWELMIENDRLHQIKQDTALFETLIKNPQWRSLSGSGRLPEEGEGGLLRRLETFCSQEALRLLRMLNQRHRLDLLPEITADLSHRLDRSQGRVRLWLEYARPLPDDPSVVRVLNDRLKRTAVVEKRFNSSLIGGCRLVHDDRVFDASVRRFLNEYRQRVERRAL